MLFLCFAFLCLIFAAKIDAQVGGPTMGANSEVEGFVRGFFDDQLTSASNQNMTDCMTRLLCENICRQTVDGKIKPLDRAIPASKLLGAQSNMMSYFFGGGDNGYLYGTEKNCQKCTQTYPNCQPAPYGQVRGVSDDYEKNMLSLEDAELNSL